MTTLLEMIVAVAVLLGLVAQAPQAIVWSHAAIERSEDIVEAQLVAETVLSVRQSNASFHAGVRSGTMNGRRWTAETRPYRARYERESQYGLLPGAPALLAIRVSVEARPGNIIVLEALSLGALP